MANLASDHWHQIYQGVDDSPAQSLAGTSLFNNNLSGAVFFSQTNTSANAEQLWQIFPYNSTYYVLRTKQSGPLGFLTVIYSPNEGTPGRTVPRMSNSSITNGDEMFWQIKPWGDGTWWLENAANGSAWHLQQKPNSLMAMSSNITSTPPRSGQRFSFRQLQPIQNAAYSTVVGPTSTETASITNPPATSAPSSSGGGLGTGAKAGIGAGVGVVAILALLILGFILVKRKRRARDSTAPLGTTTYQSVGQSNYEAEAKHHPKITPGEIAPPGELESTAPWPAELNAHRQPAELPAWNNSEGTHEEETKKSARGRTEKRGSTQIHPSRRVGGGQVTALNSSMYKDLLLGVKIGGGSVVVESM
ncbi:hypothetical protein VTL71DRAFT_5167 [Oculimacula yallundae]|uniref:Ricin B lectin domain-containing protein n=1 Tax=Oculimacula yallundae TaxID=86028 RepID=A0ABR4C1B2_9HELO